LEKAVYTPWLDAWRIIVLSTRSTEKVEVGGVHFDRETTHDKRKRKYYPAPIFIAQNYAHFAGQSPLVDADSGSDNQVRMRFTILQLEAFPQ
jgi:hypothetical protein